MTGLDVRMPLTDWRADELTSSQEVAKANDINEYVTLPEATATADEITTITEAPTRGSSLAHQKFGARNSQKKRR